MKNGIILEQNFCFAFDNRAPESVDQAHSVVDVFSEIGPVGRWKSIIPLSPSFSASTRAAQHIVENVVTA
jgi:hypothetical protein